MANIDTRNIPTAQDLNTLPRWAIIAFAARCARRVEPLFKKAWPTAPRNHLDAIRDAVEETERVAAIGAADIFRAKHYAQIADLASYVADYGVDTKPESDAYFAAHAAANAAGAIAYPDEAATAAYYAAYDASLALSAISRDTNHLIKQDFTLLQTLARDQKWNDDTPVSPQIFSLHSVFDVTSIVENNTIIDISTAVDRKLIDYFRQYPQRLYDLTPRQFEELIAELFDGFGFDVELTAATRDMGRDVIAVQNGPARLKYLIECKRYAKENKVGLAVVQRLHGVTIAEGANKGILATTSGFTDPAFNALRQTPWLLEGRDFDGLVEWLNLYQKFRMAYLIGVDDSNYFNRRRSVRPSSESADLWLSGRADSDEDAAAKVEAYYAWERAGRPWLSVEEQERMYCDALLRVRRSAG